MFSAQLARDDDYAGHMLGLIRIGQSYSPYFPNVTESNQFQILLQNQRAQSPKVRLIIIQSVHKITDVRIPRAIIDLGFDGNVTAYFKVLEASAERQQRIGQVIERAKMEDNIELAGATERFRAGQFKLTRCVREPSEKTRGLDMTWNDIDAGGCKLVFQ